MKTLKSTLLTLAALLCSTVANAYTFEIDGIYYNTSGSNATVTYKTTSYNSYSGDVVIPSTVTYNDMVYTVTSIGSYSFKNCSNLTSITIPESVTRIENDAFSNCSSLSSINIPDGVTSIGGFAFFCCSSLTSINIPNSISSIGASAFQGCTKITKIDIDNIVSWLSIEYANENSHPSYAGNNIDLYVDGTLLTEVEVPFGVTSIPDYAFYGCSSLTSIVLPASLTSIGNQAFYGCRSLTSIVLPEGVTNIEKWAFANCASLTSVVLPASLTSIGESTFAGCRSLTAINIPEGVTSIEYNTFSGCSNLASIVLPESLTSIGEYAFSNCINLNNIDIGNIESWLSIKYANESSHPNYGSGASNLNFYMDGVLLTEVEVPFGVTSIPDYAFYRCGSLTSITFPSSISRIGTRAFKDTGVEVACFNATTPPSLNSSEFFFNSYSVIVVPESAYDAYCAADYWKEDALCKRLATKEAYKQVLTLKAKDNVSALYEAIGETNLPRVVELTINGSINSWDFFIMLTKMTSLRYLDLTNAAIVYNSHPHYDSYYTENDKFPRYGLYGCNLISVKLPESITEIGDRAFKNNEYLKEVVIPMGVTSIGYSTFSNCKSLVSVNIPESVTEIEGETFCNCEKLANIILPPTIRTIGDRAFQSCHALQEIRIPSSVRSIGTTAFSNCSNLQDVYVYTIEPTTIEQSTFPTSGNNFVGTLHAPKVSYSNYYFHTQWGQFLKFDAFDEPYENFYLNGDKELNNSTGAINGTEGNNPDAEMGNNSGLIVGGDVNQNLGDVDVEHDGENGGSIIVDGNGCVNADKLHFHINVKGGKWYFFCFPFDVRKEDIKLENGADWVFRYYDGGERANNGKGGWKNVTSDGNGNHLKAATGYIFQCSNDDVLILTAKNQKLKQEKKYNELVEHVTANMHDASWNFVGNPYLSYYEVTSNDYSAPITVWDGSKYIAIRPGDDDYLLAPFEAFFVQKPEGTASIEYSPEQQMTYHQSQEASAQARARRRAMPINPDRLLVNITLSNGTDTDQTRVVFNNDAAMGYETACDASKFETAGIPQLYTIDSRAVKYAINERPVAEGIVTLGYSVPTQGNYTLAAPRMDTPVAVKDNLTGTIHNFSDGNYEFASEAGTFEGRFTVIMKAGETSIDNAEIRNQESEIYNVKGQRVENADEQGIYIKNNRKVVSL